MNEIGCNKKMIFRAIVSLVILVLLIFFLYIAFCNKSNILLVSILCLLQSQMLYRLIAFKSYNIIISNNEIFSKNIFSKKNKISSIDKVKEIHLNYYQRFLLGRFGRVLFQVFSGKLFIISVQKENKIKNYMVFIDSDKEVRLFQKYFNIQQVQIT